MFNLKEQAKAVLLLGAALTLMAAAGGATAGGEASSLGSNSAEVQLVRDDANRRVDVLVNGERFTAYIYPEDGYKPVLFPLLTANGTAVTRGFPLEPRPFERVDHPHHIGLWLNYGDVNGLDFWNNSDRVPAERRQRMGTIVHRDIKHLENGKGRAVLETTKDWLKPDGSPILHEETRYVFYAADGLRAVDRITTLTALSEPVNMKDNKEGMIAIRVARQLEHPTGRPERLTDAEATSAERVLQEDDVTGMYYSRQGIKGSDVWGTRAKWMKLGGVVGGEEVTLAILDHPANVGYPTYWHARGYGLFSANPLGQSEFSNGAEVLNFALEAQKSTTFRHRILILSGDVPPEQLERTQQPGRFRVRMLSVVSHERLRRDIAAASARSSPNGA